MVALPLWGHTIKWYCDFSAATIAIGGGKKHAPIFQNKPQHDYDHPAYIEELATALRGIVQELKMKEHDKTSDQLLADMNYLTTRFRKALTTRGIRSEGTHQAWQDGKTNENWFLPFSMATAALATQRGYPNLDFNEMILEKLTALVDIFKS